MCSRLFGKHGKYKVSEPINGPIKPRTTPNSAIGETPIPQTESNVDPDIKVTNPSRTLNGDVNVADHPQTINGDADVTANLPQSSKKNTDVRVADSPQISNVRVVDPPNISNGVDDVMETDPPNISNGVDDVMETDPPNIAVSNGNASDIDEPYTSNPADQQEPNKRRGIAAPTTNLERGDVPIKIVKHLKQKRDEKLIKEAFTKNDFLRNLLEGQRLQRVVDAMYSREVKAGEVIIEEGSVGTQLYVSASGTYEIIIKGKTVDTFEDNKVFGELAILYDATRQATIKALKSGRIWVLDQDAYKQLMMKDEIEQHDELVNFLRNVPTLNTISDHNLRRVAYLLKREFFATGSVIIRQGDKGDKFYIISAGTVTITKNEEGEVGKMGRGKFFGQLALLKDDVRQATVTAEPPAVECYSLTSSDFIEHFGTIEDLDKIPEPPKRKSTALENPYKNIKLSDLKRRGTLGEGGYGRVELMQHKKIKDLTFALKYLKKKFVVEQQQQQHVYNEKKIQIKCNSIFIVRMYNTFRDKKYLYFLMEACLGGDLWSLLQKQKNRRVEEGAARFYTASALGALAYLHDRNIVYRDLKPENLMLDMRGYLKLTDFGFAKELDPSGKTYTFSGTPEYLAPEMVLSRGHDQAVDYWALGIFIFELLVGRTPFRTEGTDYMKTYKLILRGVESIKFPQTVPRKAEHLIKKLCRSIASERLGSQKHGAQAIREHRWFTGFDWNQLNAGEMKAPYKRPVENHTDLRYFDKFEMDSEIPPDETSGWDTDF